MTGTVAARALPPDKLPTVSDTLSTKLKELTALAISVSSSSSLNLVAVTVCTPPVLLSILLDTSSIITEFTEACTVVVVLVPEL